MCAREVIKLESTGLASTVMNSIEKLSHADAQIDEMMDTYVLGKTFLDLIDAKLPDLALQFLKNDNCFSQDVLDDALILACCYGNKFLVQTLVRFGADVNYKDKNGRYPLLVCVEYGFLDLVRFLISRNANIYVVDSRGNTALILSINCRAKELTQCILEQTNSNINHQNDDGYTALMRAVEVRDIEAVQVLLEGYFNPVTVNTPGFCQHPEDAGKLIDQIVNLKGETTHDIADKFGLGHVFRLLTVIAGIQMSSQPAAETFHQDTLNLWLNCMLDVKCSINHVFCAIFRHLNDRKIGEIDDAMVASIRTLLECGADVNACTNSNINPVFVAMEVGNYPLVELLLQYDIETNMKQLLKMAAKNGRCDLIELLLKYKGDVNSFNYSYSDSPLDDAIICGHGDCVKLLIQHGARVNINYALNFAVHNNDSKYMSFLLQNCKQEALDFLFLEGSGNANSLLTAAMKRGNLQIIRQILDLGVDINEADFMGVTPLMEARTTEVAHILIQNGADVNQISNSHSGSNTPLIHFIENSYFHSSTSNNNSCTLEVVRLLLQNGASVNARNKDGRTALMISATKRVSSKLLQILVEHGADGSDRDSDGNTSVMQAIIKGCEENVITLIKFIKDKMAVLNLQNNRGLTALMLAVTCNNVRLVTELISQGADVSCKDAQGNTALLLSLKSVRESEEMVTTLVNAGSDVNWQNNDGLSPLMMAVKMSRIHFVSILLNSGADVNAVSKQDKRKTAISFLHKNLYRRDSIQTLELLVDKGARSSYVNSFLLYHIICEGHINTIPKLVQSGLGPAAIDGDERLMSAVCSGTIPPVSPLCLALLIGNARLAHYFWGNLYLTKSDLLPLTSNKVIKSFLQWKSYYECLHFLGEISSQPLSLFKLAFVEVTSAIGASPGRETRVSQLPLPRVIKDRLLFQSEIVNLAIPNVTDTSLSVFSGDDYAHLAGISYLDNIGFCLTHE